MGNVDIKTEYWIDQYLRGELSGDEVRRFEERLHAEPDFLHEVMLRKDIVVGIRAAEDQQLRDRLEQIQQAVNRGEDPANTRRKQVPQVQMLLVILLAVAAILAYLLYTWL